MDYRLKFYSPSLVREFIAEENTANLNERLQFRRNISPDLAESIASISRTYPNLDKRAVVYGGLMGLQDDDNTLLELSQKQQKAMEKSQRSIRPTSTSFWKRGTQLGFLALDAPFQNISQNFKSTVYAAQQTQTPVGKAVFGTLAGSILPGEAMSDAVRESMFSKEFSDTWKQTKESYGPTEFKRARDAIKAGEPLNLGTGFVPQSVRLEDTDEYNRQIKLGESPTTAYKVAENKYGTPITEEFKKDEYRYNYVTPQGEHVPISPGRVVAGQFSKEGDLKYAVTSTIIDGAFRLGADPINLLLGYGSGVKTAGQKIVSKAAVDDFLIKNPKTIGRALKSMSLGKRGKDARKFMFGKTAEDILKSKWGDDFLDALVENDSIARLRDIPSFRKVDTRVLDLLASVKNKDAMREIVESMLTKGDLSKLASAPYTSQFVGKELLEALPVSKVNKLPMRKSVTGELAGGLAKKFKSLGPTDFAPIRRGVVPTTLTLGEELIKGIGKIPGSPFKKLAGGLIEKGDDPFRGIVGTGGQLKFALPRGITRLFDLAPSKFASLRYVQETVENIDGLLTTMGENAETRDYFIAKILTTKTADDLIEVVSELNEKIFDFVKRENPDYGKYLESPEGAEDAKRILEAHKRLSSTIQENKKYFYDEDGYPIIFPGTKFKYPSVETTPIAQAAGRETPRFQQIAEPTALVMSQFADNFVALMDYTQLATAGNKYRKLVPKEAKGLNKALYGWNSEKESLTKKIVDTGKFPKTAFKDSNYRGSTPELASATLAEYVYSDLFMQKVLKPGWMLRLALAVRVPGEEAVRTAVYGGPSVFTHPLELLSLKFNNPFSKKQTIQLMGSMGEDFFATTIKGDEINKIAEMTGTPAMQDSVKNLTYDEIERVLKFKRLNVNPSGIVGDSYLASYIKDVDTTIDFQLKEIKGGLKKLKKQKVTPEDIEESARFLGYEINRLKDVVQVRAFNNVSRVSTGQLDFQAGNGIAVGINKNLEKSFEFSTEKELQEILQGYMQEPDVLKALQKESHGLITDVKGNKINLNVGISKKELVRGTKEELVDALALAIKGQQEYVYLTDSIIDTIDLDNPLWDVIERSGDVYKLKVHKLLDDEDSITFNTQVAREVMEYMFEENFKTAKLITSKKGGFAQAAPDGSFFNVDPYYLEAQAENTLMQTFRTGKRSSDEEIYHMADKLRNGEITEEFWTGFIGEMMNYSKDPAFIIVARDGVEEAVKYFTETRHGKKYIQDFINWSDDPGTREMLLDEDNLRLWLGNIEWEIGRLQGNPTKKAVSQFTGNEIRLESQLRELMTNAEGITKYPVFSADLTQGSQSVREFIANGGVIDGEDFHELVQKFSINRRNKPEQAQAFRNKFKKSFKKDLYDLDMGPKRIAYNTNSNVTPDGRLKDGAYSKYDEFLSVGYITLLQKPSDWLNRDPFFRWSFYTLSQDIIPFMTKEVRDEFLVGAKPWIEGSSLWDDVVKAANVGEGENSITSLEQAMEILKYQAMDEVKNLLYSSSDRHVLSDIMATYVPFPEIWQEVAKTWGKLVLENPAKFNRTRIAMDAGKEAKPWDTHNAFFETDPVTGELMFNYIDVMNVMTFGMTAIPGALGFRPFQSGMLGEDLTEEGVRVKPHGFLEGLNLVSANGFSPGFGPVVTMPQKFFTRYRTFPKWLNDFVLGNFNSPGGQADPRDELPGWMKKFFKTTPFGSLKSDEMDASYAKTVMDIYTLYYYAGKWDPEDEQSMKDALIEAEQAAATHWRIRGAAQFAYPTAIQPRYELQDKNGTWWALTVLSAQYQKMLEANDFDYFVTTQQFVNRYGLNPIPFRQATVKKEGRFPVKKSAYAFWSLKENKELMERNPSTAIYIHMDTWDDEFSYAAFLDGADQLEPEQYQKAMNQTLAQFEYQEQKEILENDKTIKNEGALQNAITDKRIEIEERYGVKLFGNIGISVTQPEFTQLVLDFRKWENEPRLKASPEYTPLKKYLDKRDEAIRVMLKGGTFTAVINGVEQSYESRGVPGKRDVILNGKHEDTKQLRILLDSYARDLAKDYSDTNFIDIYLGNFWSELDNRRYYDEEELEE